jgi:hypothetical protein
MGWRGVLIGMGAHTQVCFLFHFFFFFWVGGETRIRKGLGTAGLRQIAV